MKTGLLVVSLALTVTLCSAYGKGNSKAIFLITVDDIPNLYTEKIVQTLLKDRVYCIFFATGNRYRLNTNKDLLRSIISNGFEIGNHSACHDLFFLRTNSYTNIKSDIESVSKFFKSELNYNMRLFRTPFGLKRKYVLPRVINNLSLVDVGWEIDSFDAKEKKYDGAGFTKNVKSRLTIKRDLYIVLLHANKVTYDNLGDMLKRLNAEGSILKLGEQCEYSFFPFVRNNTNLLVRTKPY